MKSQIWVAAQFENNKQGGGGHIFSGKTPFKAICGYELKYDKLTRFSKFYFTHVHCQSCKEIYLEKYADSKSKSPDELSDIIDKLFVDEETSLNK